ncbi:hypothetical protein BGP77_08600 [Saccharospirillum sp. MSK14-1]|uniref:hypothetical protein n=1 Tax=Saccharospirillum sp. MSK14-1 TaxID=1897632 RepID=UPI000D39D7CA|nr:hypothetical protein [Saccharospirillum sp. MSK14-1]PTY35695.1 hypothetical protein BGP77_08600 [Saccharospirillum sp. MSK14-1]
MSILRDEYGAALAGIHAHGLELIERYQDLIDQEVVSAPTESLLRRAIEARTAMLGRVEAMERARGELPQAGNQERALLKAISDWVQSRVNSEATLVQRLMEAEAQWRSEVNEAADLDWSDDEQDVLSQLVIHSDRFVEELRFLQSSL